MISTVQADDLRRTLEEAVSIARKGEHARARWLLRQVVEEMPYDSSAWLWLSYVAVTTDERRAALRRALDLRPKDERLQKAFQNFLSPRHVAQLARRGCYISYARPDELLAFELSRDLRKANVRVWFDITDASDEGNWEHIIEDAQDECGVMLAIMSPSAASSLELFTEHRRFMESGKIVVPVLREPCDYTAHHIWHRAIDVSDYDNGLDTLKWLLTLPVSQNA